MPWNIVYTAILKQLEFSPQEAIEIDFGVPLTSSSCIFIIPILGKSVSPESPGPLCWRIIFRNQDLRR